MEIINKIEKQKNKMIGFEYFNNQNEKVTVIEYRRYSDITVQFEDGTQRKVSCNSIKNGLPLNPNKENPHKTKRLKETVISNQGFEMKILNYRNANDIDIKFSDGTIVYGKCYDSFINGETFNPNWGKQKVGELAISNQGEEMKLIEYFSPNNITVQFSDGTIYYNKRYSHFIDGNVRNYNKVYLYDKGYLGIGKYQKKSLQGRKWNSMFDRCYKDMDRNRTYTGTEVCEEWCCLQNFGKWYDENLWSEDCTYLDKDILVKNNTIYSPNTCILVDNYINCFFAYKKDKSSNLPTGVIKETENSYRAYLNHRGENRLRQWFKTPEEAFKEYKKEKELLAKEIADEYSSKYDNFPKELYEALYNFEVDR